MLLIGLGVPTPEKKAQTYVLLYFDSFDWKQLGDSFWKMLALPPPTQNILNKLFSFFNEIWYLIGLST